MYGVECVVLALGDSSAAVLKIGSTVGAMCARAGSTSRLSEPASRYQCVTRDMTTSNERTDDEPHCLSWCGCRSRDTALWRVCASELAGSALLVALSCLPYSAPPLHRALAAGLVVTMLVQTLDHVSGAFFNPVVLLAATLWGRVSWPRAVSELCAQLAGATLGAVALRAVRAAAADACVTHPAPDVSLTQAVVIEGALGGCLALANCGTWDARNKGLRDAWPIRIGLTVAGLSLVGGELTGASMNPARSFGPALCTGDWTHLWVYWVGPLSGSLLCTLLYMAAWRPRATTL